MRFLAGSMVHDSYQCKGAFTDTRQRDKQLFFIATCLFY